MIRVGFQTFGKTSGHLVRGIGFYAKNLLSELKKIEGLEVVEFSEGSKMLGVDLVHFPSFDFFRGSFKPVSGIANIVTIHDVVPLEFGSHYPPGVRGRINLWKQKFKLKRADAVITDAKASIAGIEKYLGVKRDRIFPIYLAAGEEFRQIKDKKLLDLVKNKFELPGQFGLYVGDVNWNKNIVNIAKASVDLGIPLVLVGKNFLDEDGLDHIERASFREFLDKFKDNPLIKRLGFVETGDLVGIYNLASVVYLVSYAEGFGLPIVEAQRCGVAVIASNIEVFREIAGEGALFVDPSDVSEITKGVKNVLENERKKAELIRAGFENAKRYSWSKTARETAEVYRKVLGR